MSVLKRSVLALAMPVAAPLFAAVSIDIDIDSAKPGADLNKNVYGQFAEH